MEAVGAATGAVAGIDLATTWVLMSADGEEAGVEAVTAGASNALSLLPREEEDAPSPSDTSNLLPCCLT